MATAPGGCVPRHIVLTGMPGVGKTTLVRKTCDVLSKSGLGLQGFYTEELRERGRRTGFDVVTFDGQRAPLARISDGSSGVGQRPGPKVGQYTVTLASFEATAVPTLRKKQSESLPVYVLDEVGKMELFSPSFIRAVKELMGPSPVAVSTLLTIPVARGRPLALVEEIRARQDIALFEVTRENRDSLLDVVVDAVKKSYSSYSSR